MTRPTEDDLFGVVSNSRRRAVIEQLADKPETTARDLSVQIACEEYDHTPESLSGTARRRVYIALIQLHLQQLDETGIIEYDSDSKRVTRGPEHQTGLESVQAVKRIRRGEEGIIGRIRGFAGGAADA